MRDYPWFKVFPAEALLETAGMSDSECGKWFRNSIRSWMTEDYSEYPWLERQSLEIKATKELKKRCGAIGGQARAKHMQADAKQNVAKSSTLSTLSSLSSLELNSPNSQDMSRHVDICTTTFDKFWAAYPKKKSKGDAERAWNKIREPAATLALILTALEWQRTSPGWMKDSGQYIPYPASYLNSKGWEDERDKPRQTQSAPLISEAEARKRREQFIVPPRSEW